MFASLFGSAAVVATDDKQLTENQTATSDKADDAATTTSTPSAGQKASYQMQTCFRGLALLQLLGFFFINILGAHDKLKLSLRLCFCMTKTRFLSIMRQNDQGSSRMKCKDKLHHKFSFLFSRPRHICNAYFFHGCQG